MTAVPSVRSALALGYLIVAGSIVGYSAYQFLLSRVRGVAMLALCRQSA